MSGIVMIAFMADLQNWFRKYIFVILFFILVLSL